MKIKAFFYPFHIFCNFKKKPIKTRTSNHPTVAPNANAPSFAQSKERPFFSPPGRTNSPFFSGSNDHQQTSTCHSASAGNTVIQKSGEEEEGTVEYQQVTPGSGPQYLSIRNQVIGNACHKMAEIRQAAENGWVWHFENEDLLLGSEMIDRGVPGANPIMDQRAELLADTLMRLARLIAHIGSGQYPITYITSRPFSDLVGHVETLHLQLGMQGFEALPWGLPGEADAGSGYAAYIRSSPGTTTVLPPVPLPWWAPVPPAACTAGPAQSPGQPEARARYTPYWVHIPDIMRHPARADRVDRDYPRSGTQLITPPTGTTRIGGQGDSFPLMEEGGQYFYMLNGQRTDLPGLQQQFPEVGQ